ncbi:MAG TPA: HAMP domain-containing protein [Gemmatimonadales bacterium]|nr:HAMP domain-containing protein [Gemmatimonadales bacterium]
MPAERTAANSPRNSGKTKRAATAATSNGAGADQLDLNHLLRVLTSVKKGDFTVRMPANADGTGGRIAEVLNDIIESNAAVAGELARMSQVVGKEGKIGQRAVLHGATGAWAASIDSLNSLIADVVQPASEIARVIGGVARGDLSQSFALEIDGRPLQGEFLRTGRTVNTMVDQLNAVASELTRVAREVGTEGKLGGQARVKGVAGTWKDLTDNVNSMAGNLTAQVRNIAQVTTAVAKGDLSKKITVDVQGEILELKNTINTMVDQLSSFASEVTRVAREVGTEGKLGGQAEVKGVGGTWKDLTDNVNSMAGNLTSQVRNIAQVTTAVANGDLSKKITVDVQGEILELKNTINTMVDQLNSFASEVTRVAREVGTEGKLGGQAQVKGVGGTWKDLTDNVNSMASNLTAQVRNIAQVTTAVARGDLSKKITVDVQGEILELKDTINTMVDQLSSFASEVTRVAREVGTEGKLGGQAQVKGVAGTWKDLTDNVNSMASNLTSQVRNIAEVTTAVARGELNKKITVDVQGEILELKNTINTMVDQLSSFASEVTRVAREVGTEGKLGGQAEVKGVGGTWKDLTDNVNSMASNLTAQVRNIAEVTTAVARGELNKKITVDVQGEILELKNTINTMVDQLNSFASEVTRVAREVGTEGKLGGQAQVKGVAGTWKDLTDNVNSMASNLTSQVRNIAEVTTAVARGELNKKITVDVRGEILELKNTINTMVDQLNSFASEVTRVAREVGTEGKLGGQAQVKGVGGTWKDLTDNVNFMAGNLTAQVRNIAEVTTAVARGELNKKITVDVRGEILELKNTINTMVDQLNSFASEVTRVAREVGTEGKLGGQAQVKGVAGTWKDLTDNVNFMAGNLTTQVRGIAKVVTAVANGDLKQQVVFEAKGEIATLADTINGMILTLATFADQVTNVAREVGIEGKLGGQARVPGAAGIWRDLTGNVNQLAANLTTQVRAIAEVATAVTKGDLTRSITVEALGEVAELKDNINEMIRNLRDTTRKNTEQDWLKTNLAKFSRMLQGQRDLAAVSKLILSDLAPLVAAHHGVFYVQETAHDEPVFSLLASYAYKQRKDAPTTFRLGEGLVGQAAQNRQRVIIRNVPKDYIRIASGLGDAPPRNLVIMPVLFEGEVKAMLELASFEELDEIRLSFLEQLAESIGIVINTISANMRTEELLKQSQALTEGLQRQQEALTETNRRLEEQARSLTQSEELLKKQQDELQRKNAELEEKADQLALISKYKSEFLANMSHELRTPLNSLLILSQILSENPDGNLTEKQVGFAHTIHSSGSDLLDLINDILDLSKIESGTMAVDVTNQPFTEIGRFVEGTFRQMADVRGVEFGVELVEGLPSAVQTDSKRLQQVLKNLLSNAFKFTDHGSVRLRIAPAQEGWSPGQEYLDAADGVVAFSVSDTGIGIAPEKHAVIFEAFQQGDGTTSRKYGGTGLGLSISRQIARLLGGEIKLESTPGRGSTFTLFLPVTYPAGAGLAAPPELQSARGRPPLAPPLKAAAAAGRVSLPAAFVPAMEDDRDAVAPGDRVLLIAEDDPEFARIMLDLAREHGFKGLVAHRADKTLALAREYRPTAITLDLRLPDADGWTILDRLKYDPATRHIPVQIVSVDEDWQRGMRLGAIDFLTKPATREALASALSGLNAFVDRPQKRLLVVEDDPAQRLGIVELIGGTDVETVAVDTGADALAALKTQEFDCMVLDLGLPDMTGLQLISRIRNEVGPRRLPTVVYTGQALSSREEAELSLMAEAVVVKDATSPERLLDETALFLHRVTENLPEPKRRMLERAHRLESVLAGRRALIVDDDVRNIFALTTLLERNRMEVLYAERGQEGIDLLKEHPDIDVVLMDVMMPEMDGYETMRAIREIPAFDRLPIIAVTAKAMKGDREKCLAAGASDYIAKPVEAEQLLSLLRVWLYR